MSATRIENRWFLPGMLAAGISIVASAAETTVTRQPPSLVTRRTAFTIPFRVSSGPQSAEVELYLSTDHGRNWRLHARQPATSGQFPFNAPGPGEYWFASRVVGGSRPTIGADPTAEVRVVIDQEQPQLTFESSVDPAGNVVSNWNASDSTLDAASFKVEFQSSPREPWRSVPLEHHQSLVRGNSVIGEASWRPDHGSNAVQVRAEISDRAGNKSVVTRIVYLPMPATSPATSPPNRAVAGTAAVPADPYYDARQFAGHAIDWPNNDRISTPPSVGGATPSSLAADDASGQPDNVALSDSESAATPIPDFEATTPTVSRFISRHVADPAGTNPLPQEHDLERTPDLDPRMTRSRNFQLDYDIESVESESIQKVELWGTSDRAATWSVWKLDEDLSSPVSVSVDEDGLYGFRVVVVARNGLAGQAPRNGDPAELWVGVDTTPPVVRIDSAAYGSDEHFGELDIRWTASDRWFADQPISLQYSDRPDGPWTTIRARVENSGRYYWPVERRVPAEIYLKIEARDAAGNVGSHQLAHSINTGGLTPRARIRGISPVAGNE